MSVTLVAPNATLYSRTKKFKLLGGKKIDYFFLFFKKKLTFAKFGNIAKII